MVVSAEDGVKPQTLEAYKTILASKTPFIVAINKIDKPGANIENTKAQLAENEIYLENYGGKVPYAEISAKAGTGVDDLLSLILILAEMETFTGVAEVPASGMVIESHLDSKRGIQATLLIKNGTLKKGMTVAVDCALCSTRIIENFRGEMINEATFSSPIRLVGFDKTPMIGAPFQAFDNKKKAEEYVKNCQIKYNSTALSKKEEESGKKIIPIILKADVWGSIEAIEKEIGKIKSESAEFKVVQKGVGPISESDIKNVSDGDNALVIGFNVKADGSALELAEKKAIPIAFFDIIYKMAEWLTEEMEKRRPKIETVETTGRAKIIKTFSRTKERQIVGGKVIEGSIALQGIVKIVRRDFEIGRAKIVNLEKGKVKTSSVIEGDEFGMMIESKIEVAPGDVLESFAITQK